MLQIWLSSTNMRSVGVKMHFEPFESKFDATEICSKLLMRNSLSLRPLQANSLILVSMHCGRNFQPWLALRPERRWKLSANAKASSLLSVSTTSPTLLQPFEPTMTRTPPLLRSSVFASTLSLRRNMFHPSLRMWTTKFQNSWKRLKTLAKTLQTIVRSLMSIEVENTPTMFEASHSLFKLQPNPLHTRIFHELHFQPSQMMVNCLNG